MPGKVPKAAGILATVLTVLLSASGGFVHAHDGTKHADAPKGKPAPAAQRVDITLHDEELVDQDGRRVRFVSDVMGEHIVLVNFVYTTCTTTCPLASAIFQQVQAQLGKRLGNDVVMVTVSVDPTTDTPERLKAYAAKFKAKSGWTWLTGNKYAVIKVLEGLGAYAEDFTTHPNMVLVGDARSGHWTRHFGFTSPQVIVAQVDELAAARASARSTHSTAVAILMQEN
jgi:protein SCO1/2